MRILLQLFIKISTLLPYIFVFIASLYRPWDTDLGWHLKYGEYFFQHGRILKENIFATEMPDFIWANTSWGIDLVYYATFHWLGFLGLTLLGALVITLTFYFFAKAFDLSMWEKAMIFPFLILLEDPVNQISFRGQVLSVMMLALVILVLAKFEKYDRKKILFWLIPIFLFWANLHGQFILGFAVMVLWFTFYLLGKFFEEASGLKPGILLAETKKFISKNLQLGLFFLLITIITFLATLIHPFGLSIYTDAFLHFKNQDLQYIIEYLPFEDLSQPWWNQMIFGILTFFGLVYLTFNEELKRRIPSIGVVSILYALSWWVRRYAWSMYYLGIPLLKPVAAFVKPDSEKIARLSALILFCFYSASAIYIKMPLSQFSEMNWEIYCSEFNNCTSESIEFVRDNNLTDNLLSLYGWGGFMIWNYPEVKPSIDGRMHLWKDETGYSAFSDYYALEQNWEDVDNSKYDVALMWYDKPIYNRLEELVEEGKWEKVYEDDVAGVFVRVKNATVSSEFILNEGDEL